MLGVVGRTPFSFPLNGEASPSLLDASSAAVVEPQLLPMNGETSIVPVGVMAALTESSPSSLDEDPILPDRLNYVLTVEVVSKRSSRTLEDWRVRTYDAVVRGYRELSAQYHRAAGESPSERAAHNPLANLETVRGELKRDILRQLLDQACRLTGEADQTLVNQPRYAQFFEDALEWREMAYSFAVSVGDSPDQQTLNDYRGELEPFTAFLQASWARVHLPVVPGRSFAVPYFLASGMTWDGRNDLTPCNRGSVDLINDLKSEVAQCPAASRPWEVRIPTSMTLLQGSPDLPVFKR